MYLPLPAVLSGYWPPGTKTEGEEMITDREQVLMSGSGIPSQEMKGKIIG